MNCFKANKLGWEVSPEEGGIGCVASGCNSAEEEVVQTGNNP